MKKDSNFESGLISSDIDMMQLKLAEDCAKEESLISKKRLSDFKPCKETLQYLSKNDVRPLKKVLMFNNDKNTIIVIY